MLIKEDVEKETEEPELEKTEVEEPEQGEVTEESTSSVPSTDTALSAEEEEQAKSDEDLETLSAIPTVLTFEGKEYKLHPLDLTTMASLRRWAKRRIMEDLHENLALMGEGAPKDLTAGMWKDSIAQLKDPLVSPSMECAEALSYWSYLSINKGNKTVTEEKAADIVGASNIREVMTILMSLNSITREELENPQTTAEVGRRRQQTGKEST